MSVKKKQTNKQNSKPLSEPTAFPDGVQGRNLSSTSILVEWGYVPEAGRNGIILSYTVSYEESSDGIRQTQEVNAPTRQATLLRLKEFTTYNIEVSAATSKGSGPFSEPAIAVETDEDSKYQ